MGAHISEDMKLKPGMKLVNLKEKMTRESPTVFHEHKRSVQDYLLMKSRGEGDLDPQNLYSRSSPLTRKHSEMLDLHSVYGGVNEVSFQLESDLHETRELQSAIKLHKKRRSVLSPIRGANKRSLSMLMVEDEIPPGSALSIGFNDRRISLPSEYDDLSCPVSPGAQSIIQAARRELASGLGLMSPSRRN